jgi:DASS family divalent anion:Na+ symporter
MLSIGFRKSGLARRFGVMLVTTFGKTSLRVSYCLSLMDTILATTVPSVPGRTGGLVFPLAEGVIQAVDPDPDKNPRRIAGYLILTMYMIAMTTGSLFITGIAANAYSAKLASQMLGIDVNWSVWAIGALPGYLGLIFIPWFILKVFPPEIKSLASIRESFGQKLKEMGPVSRREWAALLVFVVVLTLWATGSRTHIDATAVGFVGLSLMFLTGVLEWKDVAESKETWSTMIWFGIIIGFSSALVKVKFFAWLATMLQARLPTRGLSSFTVLLVIALLVNLTHYLFASTMGYIAALAPVFYLFVLSTDAPRYPAAFFVMFLMITSSSLTHYGNIVGPLLFARGYVPKKTWWSVGLMVATFHTVVYLTIGLAFWKWIGYWR